jgi:hypothetical protein
VAKDNLAGKIAAELRRIGVKGVEETADSTARLARTELRFRVSPDGGLTEFRRTGWPVMTLSARLTLPALKRVKKGAGEVAVWRSLGTACE